MKPTEHALDLTDRPVKASPPLHITVTAATATASTKLAAFDAALRLAGVANYNLIRLSSVIPPNSVVSRPTAAARVDDRGGWGDRLYVVLAECQVDAVHEEAWAGIGWTQEAATGKGLFVEHEGHSRPQVEADIRSSLEDLIAGRPGTEFGEIQMQVTGGTCDDQPLCALVVAAFEAEPWRGEAVITLP